MGRFDDGDLELLVNRARTGDGEAWSQLVDRFQSLVYSIARRYGLNEDDAADVFLTTFQNLLRSLDRLSSAAALPRWLAVSAGRESLRIRRIKSRTSDFDSEGLTLDEIVAREEADAEVTAMEMDQSRSLRKAISGLNGRCRDLLQMLYLDETPYQEVSAQLGIPIGAIGPTRGRCIEKLRAILAKSGFFD